MSMMNPAQIKFESQADVIDYVTKGMPPRKKDFNSLMVAILNRETISDEASQQPSTHVVISPSIQFDMDDNALVNAMDQIYKNRCRNRNMLMVAGIMIGALAISTGMSQHNRIKELEGENEKLSQIIEDDLPVVNISSI